jgi:HTH-type transcriptional regulator / antitoxin HigA
MITRIKTEREYKVVMKTIEALVNAATKKGGFHKLSKPEADLLARLSKLAENFEDKELKLMPIRPKSLQEAVEFKRTERGLTRAKLAKTLGIGAPKLSQIMSGRRAPDVVFLKAVYKKLDIDPEFILTHI